LSKLLTGQQLYMSLNIKAQRQSENVEEPPFEPPTKPNPPCITTVTPWGDLLDLTQLELCTERTGRILSRGRKIGPASFLFPYVSQFIPPVMLRGRPEYHWQTDPGQKYTYDELFDIHFARMTVESSISCYFGGAPGGSSLSVNFPTENPIFYHEGQPYPYVVHYVSDAIFVYCDEVPPPNEYRPFAPFGAELVILDNTPTSLFEVPNHYHPPKSNMTIMRQACPRIWSCYHWPPAYNHHITWHDITL
jgi:hypothetical protein